MCYTFPVRPIVGKAKPFEKAMVLMFSFLSPDSKFMQVVSRFTDLVVLNLLFLITCLPVFTIGAANAALCSQCFGILRSREGSIARGYFRAFRENFKQGTTLWLLMLFVCLPGLVYFDTFFTMEGPLRYLFVVFFTVVVLALFVGSYAFPWISQFANDTPTVLRNALILSLGNLPRTIAVCAMNLLPWALLLLKPELFVQVSFLWFALYFAAAAYLNTAILWKVFKPYYPPEETEKA